MLKNSSSTLKNTLLVGFYGMASLITFNAYSADLTPLPKDWLVEGSYIVTFNDPVGSEKSMIDPPTKMQHSPVPFGEHSTGQSKQALQNDLAINGKVNRIFETINAAHILMDATEALRLRQDKRVKSVEQDALFTFATTQTNPGWALDRLDQSTTVLDNKYNYNYNGAGRTIYIIDSGLALSNPTVAAEFGGRASIFYDFFNTGGSDTLGHGTVVASVAGETLMA
ncbi:MAG: hypothetical protein ABL903_04595 [Methylococcales bacterium]